MSVHSFLRVILSKKKIDYQAHDCDKGWCGQGIVCKVDGLNYEYISHQRCSGVPWWSSLGGVGSHTQLVLWSIGVGFGG